MVGCPFGVVIGPSFRLNAVVVVFVIIINVVMVVGVVVVMGVVVVIGVVMVIGGGMLFVPLGGLQGSMALGGAPKAFRRVVGQ